jgi:hypothetical protein
MLAFKFLFCKKSQTLRFDFSGAKSRTTKLLFVPLSVHSYSVLLPESVIRYGFAPSAPYQVSPENRPAKVFFT